MAKITYTNKEAINIDPSIPAKNKCMADDLNEIKNVVNENENKTLISISSTAPSQCTTGDLYFNTTSKKIFTATAINIWSSTGEDPTENTLYLYDNTIYFYDGTTLVGVGSSGAGGESLPVGSIIAFAGSNAPEGYLMCDGSNISRTANNDLFNVIGTTYGQGDGSTTFGIPNIKGRVLVGLDSTQTEFDTLGETGGSKYLQEHKHTYGGSSGGEYIGAVSTGWTASVTGGTGKISNDTATYTGGVRTGTGGVSVGNSGNLPPYIVVNYIIKAHPSAVNTSEVVNEHSTSETDVYSANYVNEALDEKQDKYELINLNSGTGNITLSKSASNYTMIEIFGSKSGCFGSVKLYSPNGKTFGLAIHNAYSGNAIQQLFANYTISGTTITKNREVYMNDNSAPTQSNDVVIDYVVGYK